MALILKKMYQGYFFVFQELKDPRADNLFLMSSPFIPFIIGFSYLYAVLNIGPKLMENRPAFKLRKTIMAFNAIQVVINSYLVFYAILESFKMSWTCEPINYSSEGHNLFVFNLIYLYFLLKLSDLFDTIFFILRKKNDHISFLHTYHHFGMVLLSWFGVRFVGGGHAIFLGLSNCIVHAAMYFYYFLRIWRPQYTQSVGWKKHITHLQLVQFMFNIVIFGQILVRQNCSFPKIVSYFLVPQNIFMMCLFLDFYYKAYIRPKKLESLTTVKSKPENVPIDDNLRHRTKNGTSSKSRS